MNETNVRYCKNVGKTIRRKGRKGYGKFGKHIMKEIGRCVKKSKDWARKGDRCTEN